MGFPRARVADQDYALVLLDVLPTGQVQHLRFIEAGERCKVKLLEPLMVGELGLPEATFGLIDSALVQLSFQQNPQELQGIVPALLSLTQRRGKLFGNGRQA